MEACVPLDETCMKHCPYDRLTVIANGLASCLLPNKHEVPVNVIANSYNSSTTGTQ